MKINDLVTHLEKAAAQLEKAGKIADGKRVKAIANLLVGYRLDNTELDGLASAFESKKPARKPAASKTDPAELKRRASVIAERFRSRDEAGLRKALDEKSTSLDVVKEACKELGYSFKRSKAATCAFLVDAVRESNKQKIRH